MRLELAAVDPARADDVNAELAHQWNLLRTDEATREIARRSGVDLALIDSIDTPPFSAKPALEGNRSDVVTTILIGVAIAVGKDVTIAALKLAWNKIILQPIEKRFGKSKAVAEEAEAKASKEDHPT